MRNAAHVNDRDNIASLSPFWGKRARAVAATCAALRAVQAEFSTFGDVNWNKSIHADGADSPF
jgi:hypothetical protein